MDISDPGKFNFREMTDADLSGVQILWKEAGFNLSFSDTLPELKKNASTQSKPVFGIGIIKR